MAEMVKGTIANVKKFGVSWKIVRRGIGWVFKNVLLLGMIAILTPGLYFYWREYPLGSKNMCFLLETFVVLYEKPLMDYALIMHIHSPGNPSYVLPEGVHFNGIKDFLAASWTMFEMSTLDLYQYIPHGPSAARGPNLGACVISPPNGMSVGK
jgi:hypothetical protein